MRHPPPGRPHRQEHGQAMAEYAMILALIVLGVAVVLPGFRAAVLQLYQVFISAIPSF